MRKTTLVAVTAALIAAGIGIWAALAHVAAKPETTSTGKPSIAAMSPFEIMAKPGSDLPSGQNGTPF